MISSPSSPLTPTPCCAPCSMRPSAVTRWWSSRGCGDRGRLQRPSPSTIIFTGSTAVGRLVMAAAAPQLTPHPGARRQEPLSHRPRHAPALAVERMIFGKSLNAGQICVAPTTCCCRGAGAGLHRGLSGPFRRSPQRAREPGLWRHHQRPWYERLTAWLEEARQAGAQTHPCVTPPGMTPPATGCPPPADRGARPLPGDAAGIFRPLLPLVPYDDIEEALAHGRPGPAPGALSHEPGRDAAAPPHPGDPRRGHGPSTRACSRWRRTMPLRRHRSSGMGHYHGREGFSPSPRPNRAAPRALPAQAPHSPLSALVPAADDGPVPALEAR